MKKLIIFIVFIFIFCLQACHKTTSDDLCQHTWGDWQYNEQSHWRNYICGHESNEVASQHVWDEGVEIITENGECLKEYTCTVCSKKCYEEIILESLNIDLAISDKINELVEYKTSILLNINSNELSNLISNLFDECITSIEEAKSITSIKELSEKCLNEVYDLIPLANGNFDFSDFNDDETNKILSLLDAYIFRNNLGGIPINKYYTLNLNSTTKEQWNKFFGEEGIICQTPKEEYWDVKTFLSNKYFLKGLCLSLEKEEIFDYIPITPKTDYTKYEYYDFNLELAKKYFALAIEDLSLDYAFSSQYPIELKLEIAFGTKTEKNEILFNELKTNIETAFNDKDVTNGNFIITVEPWYGELFGAIFPEKLYNGQFDLSYDKISWSNYVQYENYKLLSSNYDLSRGITINWSINTNSLEDDCIVYNGYRFTYDAIVALLCSENNIVDGTYIK